MPFFCWAQAILAMGFDSKLCKPLFMRAIALHIRGRKYHTDSERGADGMNLVFNVGILGRRKRLSRPSVRPNIRVRRRSREAPRKCCSSGGSRFRNGLARICCCRRCMSFWHGKAPSYRIRHCIVLPRSGAILGRRHRSRYACLRGRRESLPKSTLAALATCRTWAATNRTWFTPSSWCSVTAGSRVLSLFSGKF